MKKQIFIISVVSALAGLGVANISASETPNPVPVEPTLKTYERTSDVEAPQAVPESTPTETTPAPQTPTVAPENSPEPEVTPVTLVSSTLRQDGLGKDGEIGSVTYFYCDEVYSDGTTKANLIGQTSVGGGASGKTYISPHYKC